MRLTTRWAVITVVGLLCLAQIVQAALVDHALLVDRPAPARMLDAGHGDAAANLAVEAFAAGNLALAEPLIIEAIRADPLNPKGLTLLGLTRDAQGREDEALEAFAVAGSLGWRNQAAQQAIALKAAEQGDVRLAVIRIDALLRQQPSDELVDFLRKVARSDTGREAVLERLEANPPWSHRFFRTLTSLEPADHASHEIILAELMKSGVAEAAANMGAYLEHLIGKGFHERAAIIWRKLYSGRSSGNLLSDPEFEQLAEITTAQVILPWKLHHQPGASVSRASASPFSSHSIRVQAGGSVAGTLLDKTLAFKPGSYSFTIYAQEETRGSLADVEWIISCLGNTAKVDDGKPVVTETQGDWRKNTRRFAIPAAGCPTQKLELRVSHLGPSRIEASFAAPRIAVLIPTASARDTPKATGVLRPSLFDGRSPRG